ncbi:uncharacterized protein N7487_000971 [Penicillium crustosum]|uniref:uncharacterized protein n=1 Tax=Penicillium crustosum TaxID=36656 RepID=UPI002384ED6E|nr:uncharacterized protein N7487_000971 [Penicillium crustosum]KAJ5417421.1 hypothetical protein N7487_000971 [Penicillium crustosum]
MAMRANRDTFLPEHLWDKEVDVVENDILQTSPLGLDQSLEPQTGRKSPFSLPIPVKIPIGERTLPKAVQQLREGHIEKILHIGNPILYAGKSSKLEMDGLDLKIRQVTQKC